MLQFQQLQQTRLDPYIRKEPSDSYFHGYFYPTLQVNGQRHIGPLRLWNDVKLPATPEYEREIFIGQIPSAWNEYTLMEYLMKIGPVYFLRFMVTFSGQCRGFAYVQYLESNFTFMAIERLNEIFESQCLRTYATWSRNIRRLEIGNFSSIFKGNIDILQQILYQETECEMIQISQREGRQILVLTFQNNRKACLCRRHLLASLQNIGSKAYVSWFDRAKDFVYNRDKASIFSNKVVRFL